MKHYSVVAVLGAALLGLAQTSEAGILLNDRFMVESFNTKTNQKGLHLWKIYADRIVANEKESIAFELTNIALGQSSKNEYRIRDITTYRDSIDEKLLFLKSGALLAEWGLGEKWNVRIDFNEDGTLKDISGSRTDTLKPADVTTFKLVTDERVIKIDEKNTFTKAK